MAERVIWRRFETTTYCPVAEKAWRACAIDIVFENWHDHLMLTSMLVPIWSTLSRVSRRGLSHGPLHDSFGRKHDYLRVSLTERCNLRCKYCMPTEGITLTNEKYCLSLDEMKHLTSLFVKACGVKKIRLTGGEPTIDRKLVPILDHLKTLRPFGLQTVAMTTNGFTLKKHCQMYRDLGLDVINVSLDTMKSERFELMTRRKGWQLVHDGLMRAIEVDMLRVKLNCVVMRKFNLDELTDFARLALSHPLEVRFIEFMPFLGNKWAPDALVPYTEMLRVVRQALPDLERVTKGDQSRHETSKTFRQPNMMGSVGFITSMTDNFCSGCNRMRLTADGNLKVCLLGREETSLRDLMRHGATDQELVGAIQSALSGKRRQHAGMTILSQDVSRPMIKIARRAFHSSHPKQSSDTNSEDDSASDPSKDVIPHLFSHLDSAGRAKMVNVGPKDRIKRVAMARGEISIGASVLEKLLDGSLGTKGDILTVAKIAGIMGAKSTSNLIPMCHQIPLDHIQVEIEPRREDASLVVKAKVEAEHKTGVELECLTAVSIALLTIYDMCKSVSRAMVISDVKLVYKSKSSGSF